MHLSQLLQKAVIAGAFACSSLWTAASAATQPLRMSYMGELRCSHGLSRLVVGFEGERPERLTGITILENRGQSYSSRTTTRGALSTGRRLQMSPVAFSYKTSKARMFAVNGTLNEDLTQFSASISHPGCPSLVEMRLVDRRGPETLQGTAWASYGRSESTDTSTFSTDGAVTNVVPQGTSSRSANNPAASRLPKGEAVTVPVEAAIGFEMSRYNENFAGLQVGLMKANGSYMMAEYFARMYGHTGDKGSEITIDLDVDDVSCARLPVPAGASEAAECTYKVTSIGMIRHWFPVAGQEYLVFPLNGGPTPRKDRFLLVNGQWTSPDVRASMLEGLSRLSTRTQNQANPARDLCRSLGAGVVATGGSASSQRMYSAGGC